LKRQLQKRAIGYEALDNGLLRCEHIERAQRIAEGLSAAKIETFFRKWLRKLPHPFSSKERLAGYRYELSVLQAEFSLTQVWDRALSGRGFFEEVIRENIDLADRAGAVNSRASCKRRAVGRCRTRILQQGVRPRPLIPEHAHQTIHKESRALRTETTINNIRLPGWAC
jgi:hypothetical protein